MKDVDMWETYSEVYWEEVSIPSAPEEGDHDPFDLASCDEYVHEHGRIILPLQYAYWS